MNQIEAATLENNYGVTLLEMGYLLKAADVFKSASKFLTLLLDNCPARNACTHQQGHALSFNGYEYRYDWVACSQSAIQENGEVKQQPSKENSSNEAAASFLCCAAIKINVCCSEYGVVSDDCTCSIDWAICYSKLVL